MMNIDFNKNATIYSVEICIWGADLVGIDLEEYKQRKIWDMRHEKRIEKLVSTNKYSRQTAGKTILW